MQWTKVGLGTAKFFHENFLYIILFQLSQYQDQKFALPDIKESVFLKSSLGRWCCHKPWKLLSVNFVYKKGNCEVQKFQGQKELFW